MEKSDKYQISLKIPPVEEQKPNDYKDPIMNSREGLPSAARFEAFPPGHTEVTMHHPAGHTLTGEVFSFNSRSLHIDINRGTTRATTMVVPLYGTRTWPNPGVPKKPKGNLWHLSTEDLWRWRATLQAHKKGEWKL